MKARFVLALLVAFAALCRAGTCAAAQVIADSVADFSGVQGQNNLYYGFYDGDGPDPFSSSDFEQLPQYGGGSFGNTYWFTGNDAVGGFWTNIAAVVMHPNGPTSANGRQNIEQWAVRRWVSDHSGSISISGNVADSFSGDGDGVIGRIIVDGIEIYAATINDGNSAGANFNVSALVGIGSSVDFAVDPRSNDFRDHTPFTATISGVPEPSTSALFAVGGLGWLLAHGMSKRRHENLSHT